ncbi:hypothetical protein DE146DRAFT_664117 [Phaeosphaeria sp. MPI-PUGE-AT-0046c]|nr:hypothetical protein DE146DRAFT_664117 [Phaeosphaeria sp. MPI-PUGE-AT-0046c]
MPSRDVLEHRVSPDGRLNSSKFAMDLETLLRDIRADFTFHTGAHFKSTFVVRPSSTTDASILLNALGPLVERAQVAIYLRGAGSTPFTGCSHAAETVTVDLRLLRGISLNRDKTVVSVHVGETWSSVERELERHDLTILGGGQSPYFSGQGIACDSIEEYEVLLTSGAVLHANEVENTGIWQAIKARQEDGVVITSLKIRTLRSVDLPGDVAHYMPESFNLLAEAVLLFARSESSINTRVMFSAGYGYGRRLNTCCYFPAKGMQNDTLFQPFASLPGLVQEGRPLHSGSDIAICDKFACDRGNPARSLTASFSIRLDLALIVDIHQEWLDVSHSLEDIDGHLFSIGFSPMKTIVQLNAQHALQATDADPDESGLFTIMMSSTWKSSADDGRVREGIDMILEKSWAMSRERDLQHSSISADLVYYSGSVLHSYDEKGATLLR